ncbi:hypothetical protein U1Q18_014710, partial [Sarracenia purpurea var. burkii]
VNILRIYQQLSCFKQYQQRVSALIGDSQTKRLVNDAFILITLGGNDFVNNYFLIPFSPRSIQFRLPDYVRYLITEYRKILKKLYDLGARRVLVTGTGPLGCAPAELGLKGSVNGACIPEMQRAAILFNPQLVQMINGLNRQIGRNVFIVNNAHDLHMDLIDTPQIYGFATSKIACCGQGPYNGIGRCTPVSNLCPNRDLYVFWDPFHTSEKANRIIVQQMMTGTNKVMIPMNLSTVLALDSMA